MENENIIPEFNCKTKREDPTSPNIWRYMNISKFISLLQSEELYFSPLTEMNDVFEGAIYSDKVNLSQNFKFAYRKLNRTKLKDGLNYLRNYQKNFFTCCFFNRGQESRIMFESYSKENGVAINFNSNLILKQLSQYHEQYLSVDWDFYYGSISYDSSPSSRELLEYLSKTKSQYQLNPFKKDDIYDHEKEFRFLFHNKNQATTPERLVIKIDLKSSIKEIVAHPNCYDWEVEVLKKLTSNYCDKLRVRKSRLITPEVIKRLL